MSVRGSSPRGRGKLLRGKRHVPAPGLIPAWAGKTISSMFEAFVESGSSPRGRGKRGEDCLPRARLGLIPAWAGKTGRSTTRRRS